MKRICLQLLILLLNSGLLVTNAQQLSSGTTNSRIDERLPGVSSLYNPLSTEKISDWLLEELNLNNNFSFEPTFIFRDSLGLTHYRMKQFYKGVPLDLSSVIVHIRQGHIRGYNGDFCVRLNLNPRPSLPAEEALKLVLQYTDAETYKWEMQNEESHLKRETGDPEATYYPKGVLVIIPNNQTEKYSLSWKFDVYSHKPLERKYIYVDANDGSVIYENNRIHHFDVKSEGHTKYSNTQNFVADKYSGGYRLRESGRGSGIETYDMQNGMQYGQAIDFTHDSVFWDSTTTGDDIIAIDAHFGAERTYDYYLDQFNWNSIDGQGAKLLNYVHFGQDFPNAFWDGQRMSFGDGNAEVGPLITLDIVGHEISHGLIQNLANLQMSGESAALSESICDIFGMLIEHHTFPNRPDSLIYVTGEQVFTGGARSMIDPHDNENPTTYKGQYWSDQGNSSHSNGIVHGHWFYILSEGKAGINDNSDTFKVVGIGKEKASQILFRSLSVYLTPQSNFEDARRYSIQAARDLFGGCSPEMKSVTGAWFAVGVGGRYSETNNPDFEFVIDHCTSPKVVTFQNKSTGSKDFTWDFGDNQTSKDINPTHEYQKDGFFTVTLTTTGCDNSTMKKVVDSAFYIDNTQKCDTSSVSNQSDTVRSCMGILYDSGGEDGSPQSNTTNTITIAPPNAESVEITFESFDYMGFNDQVAVYDGNSTSGKLLGTFNHFNTPQNSLLALSGSFRIQETVGQTFPGQPPSAGFKAMWTCKIHPPSTSLELVDSENIRMSVFPNPVRSEICLSSNEALNNVHLELLNQMGKRVKLWSGLSVGDGNTRLEIPNVSAGIYFLCVSGNSISRYWKIIIE